MIRWLKALFGKTPPPALPYEEQQRLGQAEWEQWHFDNDGKAFFFGDLQNKYNEIRAKYPLWKSKIEK